MKLCEQPRENCIEWESQVGVVVELNESYPKLGLVTEESDHQAVYHPQHMNPEVQWSLSDDIYVYKKFDDEKGLAIIPYTTNNVRYQGYDFIFIWSEGEDSFWEKAFILQMITQGL